MDPTKVFFSVQGKISVRHQKTKELALTTTANETFNNFTIVEYEMVCCNRFYTQTIILHAYWQVNELFFIEKPFTSLRNTTVLLLYLLCRSSFLYSVFFFSFLFSTKVLYFKFCVFYYFFSISSFIPFFIIYK